MIKKPLFIFEMANNHMGSVEHGLKIIQEFHKITDGFDFDFAFKFQFRDIPTFIHPDYKERMDIKYVKRFTETALSRAEWVTLIREIKRLGFISICTPFDEKSVDAIEELHFDIIKIGSCSMPDWPLLERIVKTDKPIIASTAAVTFYDLDQIVNFFQHRERDFSLMHCVGEYPTPEEHLQLNRIGLFKNRYPGVPVGFSTHEEPTNFSVVQLAIAKGARIFEKHVQIDKVNDYSATPEQALEWLRAAQRAFKMCGVTDSRSISTIKEHSDLRQFKRGAFAKREIKKGEAVGLKDMFFAFPNQEGQVLANDVSRYTHFYANKTIKKNGAVIDVKKVNIREKVYSIVEKADKILKKHRIPIPSGKTDISVSYHYGLDRFYEVGAVLITCINREYCKKLIVMFAGQGLPIHHHKKKEETFYFLAGDWTIDLEGEKKAYKPGDILTVERGATHIIKATTDGVLEEVSSTHYPSDSYYEDEKIIKNKNRRTLLTYWI